mgnify:CR=1 FL=1
MSRGTPEDDLNAYMDMQERAEAEHNAELEVAEDTARLVSGFIKVIMETF